MFKLSLNGEWNLNGGEFTNVVSSVPGCIHTDLMNNELIENPYFRDNESKVMYLGETDWIYDREFTVSEDLLQSEYVMLKCDGLDTFSSIVINGYEIGITDNMFRIWTYDIKEYLNIGVNKITIKFFSTFPYINEKLEERYLHETGIGDHRILGSNYVRKMQCNYGWDWGPMCVTAGIWRDIQVLCYNDTRIDHIQTKQKHTKGKVELELIATLSDDYVMTNGKLEIELSLDNQVVETVYIDTNDKVLSKTLTITEPKLWWPNNLGEQPLYEVKINLYKGEDIIDSKSEKIGLRTLNLDRHPDEYGETFQFVVNDIPFFAKGANWIPIDTFVTRGSEDFYRQLLTDAKDANMNFLRVWGGGIYEPDIFYDLCDELGICVWQDFMFACSAYPIYDKDYEASVKAEVKDNVIRLRNHASLALWCGNNEIEYINGLVSDDTSHGAMSWKEYKYMFDDVIPTVMKEYDGETDYWASSPMDGPDEIRTDGSDSTKGDAHLWDVWHGLKPFEWYRTCDHRFNSEFGFQSFPEPEVVNSYTEPDDRNITSFVMEKHQRSGIGNSTIIHYMLSWFKLPSEFEKLLWTSQILQSLAIKYAVENWRRKMPQGMGTIYWQLNDCWPVASWSSIDYIGNYKALHYSAKKFFNPILISGIEDKELNTLEIHLSNDTLEEITGWIKWRVFNFDGRIVDEGTFAATVGANSTSTQKVLELEEFVGTHEGATNHVVTYSFEIENEVKSENTTYFKYPKHLELQKPEFSLIYEKLEERRFKVRIATDKPSLWVWMELENSQAKYSDRFFDLFNDQHKEVIISPNIEMDLDTFKNELKVYSIYDTY